MAELKDNSFSFKGELANVQFKTRKDGKIAVLRVEAPTQDLSAEVAALVQAQGSSVGITMMPAQTELDTEGDEADGQETLDGME
ncbi:hypothetical protein [Furfurilactobacillus entadae]|uniref:hypothetical protein n=1 Tax=Furfurilactobacillus entadae TaxID=2922307 RepID=UPI0035EA9D17